MPESIFTRIKHAWDIFRNRDPTESFSIPSIGPSTSYRPDRSYFRMTNEKSIINALYTRIAIDISSIPMQHVRLDENNRYIETINSGLNYILTQEANIDQASRPFIRDIVMSMFDEGHVAVVPVDTTIDPTESSAFDILTLRTGKVVEWYPQHVKVKLYNEKTGHKEEIIIPKRMTAIIENPLYSVMNEPNGTLKRLIRKLNILDAIDEQSGSGKLDIIIQLPYVIKSTARQEQAERRKLAIEEQLANSKYGIAFIDSTDKITQLNRPAENNLMKQIEYLTSMLFSQLGVTEEVFLGTANAETMLNYQNRTIFPLLLAIIEEFNRKFLSKTARTQKQAIVYFKDAFSLAPVDKIADMADKFTRNEILSSNEIRSVLGFKASSQEGADDLRNKNIQAPEEEKPEEEKAAKEKTLTKIKGKEIKKDAEI